jgi:hypothetical protein
VLDSAGGLIERAMHDPEWTPERSVPRSSLPLVCLAGLDLGRSRGRQRSNGGAGRVYPPSMSAGRDEQERADRDRERSREAHWRAAEAGAEEEDQASGGRRQPREQENDWENEGGALDRESDETADNRQQD